MNLATLLGIGSWQQLLKGFPYLCSCSYKPHGGTMAYFRHLFKIHPPARIRK